MTPELREALAGFRTQAEGRIGDVHHREVLDVRLERHFPDAYAALRRLYGDHPRFAAELAAIADRVGRAAATRGPELRRLDYEREITPDWFQRPRQVGYVAYADRFAGTLAGVRERIPYLRELGVTYLHLMPLLKAREGPNDGGYAVADYGRVEPALGTMEDLRALAADLRAQGMSLCVDLVLNHTAREHPWARRAIAGEAEYRARYLTFADRTEPDAYERTLPLVFPEFKPANFTWCEEMGRWVWTTFNDFQWDLDYSNPAVFREMLGVMLDLAGHGVDVLRLDAVPFMWKRLGTDSQNQPEVHALLRAFRALVRIAAPATIFKAEAIVSPDVLVRYLGECDLAYHNALMVGVWSALASRKVALLTHTLRHIPPAPSDSTWVTYLRCHDDIGWAITPANAAAAGEDDAAHRRFLAEFYAGRFPGSFARGAIFQPDPGTGEGRTNGSAASLAGLELALERHDAAGVEIALRRLLLLHSVVLSWGGIPLIYMGDEIGLLNDHGYESDPARAMDTRWMHRPPMDWERATRRHDPSTVEGRLFAGLRRLLAARTARRALHGAGRAEALWSGNPHVLAYRREHAGQRFLGLANFSEHEQRVGAGLLDAHGMRAAEPFGSGHWPPHVDGADVALEPYGFMWLTASLQP